MAQEKITHQEEINIMTEEANSLRESNEQIKELEKALISERNTVAKTQARAERLIDEVKDALAKEKFNEEMAIIENNLKPTSLTQLTPTKSTQPQKGHGGLGG